MAFAQNVTLGNRVLDLHKFTGEVVDEKTWATTQIAGGGGGYNAGTGQHNAVSIASVNTTHNQFFLKADDGKEMAVELANSGVALRKGHRVTVFWAVFQGEPNGPFVAVYNHTMATSTILDSAIESMASPPGSTAITIAWVVSFFAICLYGLGIIALIVLTIFRRKKKKEFLMILRSAVDRLVSAERVKQ